MFKKIQKKIPSNFKKYNKTLQNTHYKLIEQKGLKILILIEIK